MAGAYTTEQRRAYMNAYRAKRRLSAKEFLGGRCQVCGSQDDLEFDHIDPKSKVMPVASMLTASKKSFWMEVAKCQLLCHEHHRDKTVADGRTGGGSSLREPKPIKHGSAWTYSKHKCRCDRCKDAKMAARKNERVTATGS